MNGQQEAPLLEEIHGQTDDFEFIPQPYLDFHNGQTLAEGILAGNITATPLQEEDLFSDEVCESLQVDRLDFMTDESPAIPTLRLSSHSGSEQPRIRTAPSPAESMASANEICESLRVDTLEDVTEQESFIPPSRLDSTRRSTIDASFHTTPTSVNNDPAFFPRWPSDIIRFKDERGRDVSNYQSGSKKFIRIPSNQITESQSEAAMINLEQQITGAGAACWGLKRPRMLMNVVGDIDQSHYAPQCLKEAVKGLFRMTTNTWIITEGYDTVFNNIVGRGVRELQEECNAIENSECNVNITSLGVSTWNNIVGTQKIAAGEIYDISEFGHSQHNRRTDSFTLDTLVRHRKKFVLNENNTHFLMVEGSQCRGSDLRKMFFHHMRVPKATLLVGGGKLTLQKVGESVLLGIPCILIEGSGGLADLLAPLLRKVRNLDTRTTEQELADPHPEELREHLILCLRYQARFLICSSTSFEQSVIQEHLLESYLSTGFDDAMSLLMLCHSWNCLRQATRVIGTLERRHEPWLVDCFAEFLEKGSTRFVDLLLAHDPDICDKLAVKHFRALYHSDRIAFSFVNKFMQEQRKDVTGMRCLVAQMNELLYKSLEPHDEMEVDANLKNFASLNCNGTGDGKSNAFSQGNTGKIDDQNNYNIINNNNNNNNNNNKHILEDSFDAPFHLFLWSLFYKQYDLARYLWCLCNFPIANGIIASHVLRSLAQLRNTHSESNRLREDEAAWFESQASSLLSKCNDRSQMRTKFILMRNMSARGCQSCLEIVTNDDENAYFLENAVCIRHLDDVWTRCRVSGSTPWVTNCLLLGLFLLSLAASLWTTREILVQICAPLSAIFLVLFIISASYIQRKKQCRYQYTDLKPVLSSEEKIENRWWSKWTKQESWQLLQCGVGMDVFYEEIHGKWADEIDLSDIQLCRLRFSRLYREFLLYLDTPQNKFLLHVGSFMFYLAVFFHVILSAKPDFPRSPPTSSELVLYSYWLAYLIHEVKQLSVGGSRSQKESIKMKLNNYWLSWWNRFDGVLFLYGIILLIYRYTVYFSPTVNQSEYLFVSVINLYSTYFVLWCLRTLQIFAVNHSLGPKLIMIRYMLGDLTRILLYILLITFSYGVWVKSVKRTITSTFLEASSNQTFHPPASPIDYFWTIQRSDFVYFWEDLWSHPLWHLFGESFIDDLDDHLPPINATLTYRQTYQLNMIKLAIPFVRVMYVLITVVLLLNLMIAVFQYSIERVQSKADKNWNIYRKSIIFEYNHRAILPAPLSLIFDLPKVLALLLTKLCWISCTGLMVVKRSKRFNCSMLSFTPLEESVKEMMLFVQKWEKMIQRRLMTRGGDSTYGVSGGDRLPASAGIMSEPLKMAAERKEAMVEEEDELITRRRQYRLRSIAMPMAKAESFDPMDLRDYQENTSSFPSANNKV